MNCREYKEMNSAYVDRELADADAVALFAHLTGCAECRTHLTETLALRESIQTAQRDEFPAGLDRRMRALALGDRPATPPASRLSGVRIIRKKFSVPMSVVLVLVTMAVMGSVYVTSTYFPRHEVIEKNEKELVYIMELPQVEVKGQAVTVKHIR
jgi:anti-sigma factor RsiW